MKKKNTHIHTDSLVDFDIDVYGNNLEFTNTLDFHHGGRPFSKKNEQLIPPRCWWIDINEFKQSSTCMPDLWQIKLPIDFTIAGVSCNHSNNNNNKNSDQKQKQIQQPNFPGFHKKCNFM